MRRLRDPLREAGPPVLRHARSRMPVLWPEASDARALDVCGARRKRRELLRQMLLGTGRAFETGRVGGPADQLLEAGPAIFAFVFVDRHYSTIKLQMRSI